MPKERILVVDDDPDVVELCRRILTSDGYLVKGATSGQEALEMAKREPFDLLLVDVMMPGMDGIEVYRSIRGMAPEVAGVIITAYGSLEGAVEAIRLGFSGFVTKPFSPEALALAVGQALARRRLERENARLRALIPLFELSRAFMGITELEELLNRVVQVAREETGADRASLMLLEDGGLTIEAAAGLQRGLAAEEGLAALAMERGEALLLDGEGPLEPRIREAMGGEVSSALCVPLRVKGRLIGVLSLAKLGGPPFTQVDLEMASILSGQAAIAIENARLFKELREGFTGVIAALATAIDAKDSRTRGHSERVARYAAEIARELGLGPHEVEFIRYAGLLHDIGKIGVSKQTLHKPDVLDVEEWEVLRAHPVIGAKILEPIPLLKEIVPMVRHHHEHYDGTGYPDRLAGEAIPLGARILGVADAFDPRPYSPAMPLEQAIALLRKGAGKQWDPEVVGALLKVLERERLGPLEAVASPPMS